jgi:hypothetical protein
MFWPSNKPSSSQNNLRSETAPFAELLEMFRRILNFGNAVPNDTASDLRLFEFSAALL